MRMKPSRSNRFVGRAASSFSREVMRQQRAKQRYETRHGRINNVSVVNENSMSDEQVGRLGAICILIIIGFLWILC